MTITPSPHVREFATSTGDTLDIVRYEDEYIIRDKADEECIVVPVSDLSRLIQALATLKDAAT